MRWWLTCAFVGFGKAWRTSGRVLLERCMSRRILQLVTAVLGLIPIVTGVVAMDGIDDPLYVSLAMPRSPVLDSNLHFCRGLDRSRHRLALAHSLHRTPDHIISRDLGSPVSWRNWQGSIGRACRSPTRSIYWLYGARGYRSAVVYLLAATDRTSSRRGRDIVVHEVVEPIG